MAAFAYCCLYQQMPISEPQEWFYEVHYSEGSIEPCNIDRPDDGCRKKKTYPTAIRGTHRYTFSKTCKFKAWILPER